MPAAQAAPAASAMPVTASRKRGVGMADISASLEDYLETIFVLHQQSGEVRVTDIATALGVSKPSVNRAVSTLRDAGFLEHEFYGTVILTPTGETRAAQVLHRHKLIRHFLHHTLGVPEEIAEEDACRVEHVVSAQTIQHLYDYLSRQEDGYEG